VYFGIIKGDFDKFNWKFFLFLQNFNTYFTDFFWESWSLTIEEWFYILTPVGILLFHFTLRKVLTKKWVVLAAAGGFIVLPLLYRISISGEQVDQFWLDVKFRKVVITRLDAIMYGVIMAWVQFYYPVLIKKTAPFLFVAGAVLMYTVMHFAKLDPTGFYAKTFYFSAIGLGAAMMLPLAGKARKLNNYFGRAITHISLISYSMYLINLSVVAQVIHANFWPQEGANALLMYFVYWTIVIVLSTLIYKFFEKPMMDLRDKTTVKTEI
jgi:peptidoglycan/LPS O-acetylase OafA/YrhL